MGIRQVPRLTSRSKWVGETDYMGICSLFVDLILSSKLQTLPGRQPAENWWLFSTMWHHRAGHPPPTMSRMTSLSTQPNEAKEDKGKAPACLPLCIQSFFVDFSPKSPPTRFKLASRHQITPGSVLTPTQPYNTMNFKYLHPTMDSICFNLMLHFSHTSLQIGHVYCLKGKGNDKLHHVSYN